MHETWFEAFLMDLGLRQALKLGTFLRRQNDNCRLRDAAHAFLNYDLCISDSWY